MTDIVEFLRARLDEDERAASEAAELADSQSWWVDGPAAKSGEWWVYATGPPSDLQLGGPAVRVWGDQADG